MSTSSEQSSVDLAAACRDKFFAMEPNLDAVVTTNPIHIGYLGGYRSILQDMSPYRQALVVTRDRVALVTGASDGAAALEVLARPDIIWRYGTFYVGQRDDSVGYVDMPPAENSFGQAFAAALSSFDFAGKRVGCDFTDGTDQGMFRVTHPNACLVGAAEKLEQSRSVKLDGELERMRRASRITDKALARIHDMIRPGISELEIAGEISRHMVRNGAVPRFVVVTSGERTSRVDAYATSRMLSDGDLVRLDIGCTVGGYYSDMARTRVVGLPLAEQVARYECLLTGEQAQLGALRPGVLASDVYNIAMAAVRKGALSNYRRNHCGHGIGLRANEYPAIAPGQDVVLETGMVVCVETPYYELGWGGMMVEDTAIITANGYELLTDSSRLLTPNTA